MRTRRGDELGRRCLAGGKGRRERITARQRHGNLPSGRGASPRIAVEALLNDAFNRRIDITHDLRRGRRDVILLCAQFGQVSRS